MAEATDTLKADVPPPPPKRTLRQRVMRQARRLLVLYLIYVTGMFFLQRWLIFPHYLTRPEPNAGQGVDRLDRWWIVTPQGRVEAWFLPGDGVSPSRPGPAVLFAHGNAELIEHWPEAFAAYRTLGVSVLLPEYRGYGRSAGTPSQAAITEDFTRFYDLLAARPEVDRARIFFHGRSIGGAAACALAAVRPPAAMVLQSSFISVVEMSRRYFVPSFLITDPFDNLSVVSRLNCPVIIFHGRRDGTIPFSHGEALHRACTGSRFVAYDCDHNDCPPDWNSFMDDIAQFLRDSRLLPDAASHPSRP